MSNTENKIIWITAKETSELLNITGQAVRKNCKLKRYITRPANGPGGRQYEIQLTSLPISAQLKYWQMKKGSEEIIKNEDGDDLLQNGLTERETEIALARAALVNLYLDQCENEDSGKRLERKDSFIRAYNNKALNDIYAKLGEVKFQTIERWKRIYLESGRDYTLLARKYKNKTSAVTKDQADILTRKVLSPNAPLISEVIRDAVSEFELNGLEPVLKPISYRRWLDDFRKEHFAIWTFYREGDKALNDKCLPSIERDYDVIDVGDIIIADGHTLNFEIINPFTGKPKRMTMILFIDMKSMMPLGAEIMPSENVNAIAVALRRSILFLGKIPKVVYLDNGRAFGSKYFNGTDIRTTAIPGLFAKLGIKVMHAWPYHPQSKTIERLFRTFAELERKMPTYVGTSIQMQPPRLNRGERLHRAVYEKMVNVQAFDLFTAHKAIAWWFDQYANRKQQDGVRKNIKPIDMFNAGKGPGIDKKELTFLMMSERISTIYKNGIRFLNTYYYDEALFGYRKDVLIKYDLIENDSIYVYEIETGNFICEARKADKVHPAAGILGTADDVDLLNEQLQMRSRLRKSVVAPFRAFVQDEVIPGTMRNLQQANILSIEDGKVLLSTPEITTSKKETKKRKEIDDTLDLLGYSKESIPQDEDDLITWESEKEAK